MSTQTHPPTQTHSPLAGGVDSDVRPDVRAGRGSGWLMFATVFLVLLGVLNIVYGIAALQNKQYFNEGGLLWSNLSTWGWVSIVVGAVQVGAAGLLYARKTMGIILALWFVVCSFVANFLSIGAYPVWSVTAMVLSGIVMWALTVSLGDRWA